MLRTLVVLLSSTLGFAHTLPAQAVEDHHHMHGRAAPSSSTLSEGTVKKLDQAKGRITLAHGPLKNLDMPAMTMPFGVADGKLLAGLKEGDKVRFWAEDRNGALIITRLERAQ